MGKLTVTFNRTEGGRGGELDGEAELRRGATMAVSDTGADSARGWRERVRGGMKELQGEVARLGARGIEARRREVAGIGTGAASGS